MYVLSSCCVCVVCVCVKSNAARSLWWLWNHIVWVKRIRTPQNILWRLFTCTTSWVNREPFLSYSVWVCCVWCVCNPLLVVWSVLTLKHPFRFRSVLSKDQIALHGCEDLEGYFTLSFSNRRSFLYIMMKNNIYSKPSDKLNFSWLEHTILPEYNILSVISSISFGTPSTHIPLHSDAFATLTNDCLWSGYGANMFCFVSNECLLRWWEKI